MGARIPPVQRVPDPNWNEDQKLEFYREEHKRLLDWYAADPATCLMPFILIGGGLLVGLILYVIGAR